MSETKEINSAALETVAKVLQEKFGFATTGELDRAVADIAKKTEERKANGNSFSLSKMFRGMRAMRGETLNTQTADADVAYVKALSTGATPGSYLVPTIQAEEIIEYLNLGGVARASGVRIWPMNGIQKMNVPAALGTPTWLWTAQNSAQTASDPNLGQMSFDLKERRCLIAIPNQLLAVSVPAFDAILAELIGLGAAEHEDAAFFATSTVSGGPTALYAASGITTLLAAGGSANGGNLAFSDVLAVLAQSVAVKAKGPFVWYMSGRTYYQRVLGLVDSNSRPLAIPTAFEGLRGPDYAGAVVTPVGMLFGHPVYVTPQISNTESNGSGTNQSHIIFTNPKYCHIAQDGNIEMAISVERYFDANQTAVRSVQHEDMGYSPAAGIVVLEGVD